METQIGEIWWWLGQKEQYENGVTNKDVVKKFGESHREAWELLKQRSRYHRNMMFYEDGKWKRWFKN